MDRRTFIKSTGTGLAGLTIGFELTSCKNEGAGQGEPDGSVDGGDDVVGDESFALTNWLNIAPDGRVSIVVVKAEMGQGVTTALPMIVAEELDADWSRVEYEMKGELGEYATTGPLSATVSSTSVRKSYDNLRRVGAAARQMLMTAAAARFGVDISELSTGNSIVTHPSKGELTYGELAEEAAGLKVPMDAPLKAPEDFKIIGKRMHRLDTPGIVEGIAVFGSDVVVPDMLYAAVRQSPVLGGDVADFDSLSVDGTKAEAVVKIPSGVAVVAKSWWEAQRVADSIGIEFDAPEEAKAISNDTITSALEAALQESGINVVDEGDAEGVFAGAGQTHEAVYSMPLLAHATMDCVSCTAHVTDDSCDIWVPTQSAVYVWEAAKEITGFSGDAIRIHPTLLGGGSGRKFENDYPTQALLISKELGLPVKVVWSREQDIQHDFYRPAFMAEMKAGIDEAGMPTCWIAKSAGPSVLARVLDLPVDQYSVEGFKELPYGFDSMRVDHIRCEYGVPVGFWRSVGFSQNTFFVEGFIDELAHQVGEDPLEFRLSLLAEHPRGVTVLQKVAEMADFGNPPSGRAHGIAFTEAWNTIIAQVAEISVEESSQRIRVHKVYCAVDCGEVINPDIVEAQIEGGVIFGLAAALMGEITVANGKVEQSNFHDYKQLLMADSPEIQVETVLSGAALGGIGELGVMPIAPAVVNGVFALTGQRIRSLPLTRSGFTIPTTQLCVAMPNRKSLI